MKKLNKRDRTLIKLYNVINLFNWFDKVVEKLVAKNLSQFYEAQGKPYKRQMERTKHQFPIDVTAFMIDKVQKIWEEK